MERTLYVERLYSLGDFKNIKFSNALTGIPEELAKNDKIVGLLFFQQALSCEIAYRKYYDMVNKITTEKIQDVLSHLEEKRTQTLKELYEEIKSAEEATPKSQEDSEEDQEKETN